MTVAFGTSMPTSITVVATSTSIAPAAKAAIVRSRSAIAIRPWTRPTRASGNTRARSSASISVAAFRSSFSDSSTSGQTTNACRPARSAVRTRS